MIPTILFLGCLYASVTARFVFFRAFRHTDHLNSHTMVGWGSWAAILLATWVAAFIISQVIPFFSSRKCSTLFIPFCVRFQDVNRLYSAVSHVLTI
jgi:hypothetical protein